MNRDAERIVVINPNSTEAVTQAIDGALEPLRMAGGPEIVCLTLAEGPPGIETQADIESVVAPICEFVRARDNDAAAFVIACYSDPGLQAARETTSRPVFGIAECAMLTALTKGERFGLISILASGVQRHLRHVRQLGLNERFAGEVPVGLGVTELGDETKVLGRMIETGERLRDEYGADVLIFGCAGMADYRDRVAESVGLPVVEPSQAAVTMAIGAVRC
jgi:Asp/Glu/hydantoin racemase